jgi:hypothetical protein
VTEETTPGPIALPGRAAVSARSEWASFNKLWLEQSVSQLGTAVTMVALPLVAVLQLHAGALQMGGSYRQRVALLVLALLMLPTPLWFVRTPVWRLHDLGEGAT